VETLRSEACKLLVEGSANGRLQTLIDGGSAQSCDADIVAVPVASTEALRSNASKLLTRAVENGRLDDVLSRVGQGTSAGTGAAGGFPELSKEALREEACSLVTAAGASGRLQQMLSGAPTGTEITGADVLRSEACNLLAGASASGRLQELCGRAGEEITDVETLRSEACKLLVEGSANGRLQTLIDSGSAQSCDADAAITSKRVLRSNAIKLITRAVENGRMDDVLSRIGQGTSTGSRAAVGIPELSEEALREARELLSGSVNDGSLTRALRLALGDDLRVQRPAPTESSILEAKQKARSALETLMLPTSETADEAEADKELVQVREVALPALSALWDAGLLESPELLEGDASYSSLTLLRQLICTNDLTSRD